VVAWERLEEIAHGVVGILRFDVLVEWQWVSWSVDPGVLVG